MSDQDKGQPEAFADAMDAPIVETIAGREFTLPLMELEDLATVARRIANQQKEKALAALPLTATDEQKQNIVRFYNDKAADIDTVTAYVFDVEGSQVFLRWALNKAGAKDPGEQKRLIRAHGRKNGWRAVSELARRVSALFPPPNTTKGTAGPNPQAGQNPATQETGDNSGSSSSEPPDAQQDA